MTTNCSMSLTCHWRALLQRGIPTNQSHRFPSVKDWRTFFVEVLFPVTGTAPHAAELSSCWTSRETSTPLSGERAGAPTRADILLLRPPSFPIGADLGFSGGRGAEFPACVWSWERNKSFSIVKDINNPCSYVLCFIFDMIYMNASAVFMQ